MRGAERVSTRAFHCLQVLLLAISAHVFNGLELKALLPRQRSGNWSENSSVALPVGCEQDWLLIAAGWFSTCEHWREILQWASRLLANTILYRYKFNQRSKISAGIWRIPVGSPKEKQRHWLSGGRTVIRTLNRTFVSWFAWSACYLNEIRTLSPVFKKWDFSWGCPEREKGQLTVAKSLSRRFSD